MVGEADNIGNGPRPRTMFARAFDRGGNRREVNARPHGLRPERAGAVEQPVPVNELNRLLADDGGRRNGSGRHKLSPTSRDSASRSRTEIGPLIQPINATISSRLTIAR